MAKIGKISSLKKEYNVNNGSLEASLAINGYSRFPGTGVRFVPYKEYNGDYRTGLNPKAPYLMKMDKDNRDFEVKRITALKAKLEEMTGIELGPRSDYYSKIFDPNTNVKAQIVRLKEGDNSYDLDNAFSNITYEWLRGTSFNCQFI